MSGERYTVDVRDFGEPFGWRWFVHSLAHGGKVLVADGTAPDEPAARDCAELVRMRLEGRDVLAEVSGHTKPTAETNVKAALRAGMCEAERDAARAELADLKTAHESRRQRASLAIGKLRGALKLRACTTQVEDAAEQAAERIADLEHYGGEYLSHMGACSDSDDDGESPLCTDPGCTYCEMARAIQPVECGAPLVPREVRDA